MDNNPNIEPNNQELENAANALNEAAIEAEAPAEAPAETPAEPTPVIEALKIEETTANTTPAAPAKEEKKGGKKGLAIGIAAGAVLVAGGGFAVAYTMDNNEENIALSAIADLFSNRAKTVSGYFELTPLENDIQTNCIDGGIGTNCGGSSIRAYTNPISRVRVDIKNSTNADNEANTSATFLVTYNDKDFKLTVDSVVVKDYTLYVSVSNLKEAAKQALEEVGKSTSGFSEYADLYEDLINKVAGEIDGIWWKISIPELVDSIDEISATDKAKIKETYSCVVDVANKAAKDGGKYADIYKKNAFVSISKYTGGYKPSATGDLYSIKLDANKFADFANAMTDQVDSYGLEDCMKKLDGVQGVSTTYEKEKVEAKSFEEAFKSLSEDTVLVIKNGFFSHKLSGIYYVNDGIGLHGVLDMKIEDLTGTIAAPSDAKNVTDLVKNVTKAYEEWQETAACKYMKKEYPSYYNVYCDATTNKPLPQYETMLKNTFDV